MSPTSSVNNEPGSTPRNHSPSSEQQLHNIFEPGHSHGYGGQLSQRFSGSGTSLTFGGRGIPLTYGGPGPSPGFGGPGPSQGFGGPGPLQGFDNPQTSLGFGGQGPTQGFDNPQTSLGFGGQVPSHGFDNPQTPLGFGAALPSHGFGDAGLLQGFNGPGPTQGLDVPQHALGFGDPRPPIGFVSPRPSPGFGGPRYPGPVHSASLHRFHSSGPTFATTARGNVRMTAPDMFLNLSNIKRRRHRTARTNRRYNRNRVPSYLRNFEDESSSEDERFLDDFLQHVGECQKLRVKILLDLYRDMEGTPTKLWRSKRYKKSTVYRPDSE